MMSFNYAENLNAELTHSKFIKQDGFYTLFFNKTLKNQGKQVGTKELIVKILVKNFKVVLLRTFQLPIKLELLETSPQMDEKSIEIKPNSIKFFYSDLIKFQIIPLNFDDLAFTIDIIPSSNNNENYLNLETLPINKLKCMNSTTSLDILNINNQIESKKNSTNRGKQNSINKIPKVSFNNNKSQNSSDTKNNQPNPPLREEAKNSQNNTISPRKNNEKESRHQKNDYNANIKIFDIEFSNIIEQNKQQNKNNTTDNKSLTQNNQEKMSVKATYSKQNKNNSSNSALNNFNNNKIINLLENKEMYECSTRSTQNKELNLKEQCDNNNHITDNKNNQSLPQRKQFNANHQRINNLKHFINCIKTRKEHYNENNNNAEETLNKEIANNITVRRKEQISHKKDKEKINGDDENNTQYDLIVIEKKKLVEPLKPKKLLKTKCLSYKENYFKPDVPSSSNNNNDNDNNNTALGKKRSNVNNVANASLQKKDSLLQLNKTNSLLSEGQKPNICNICLEKINDKSTIEPCEHYFCKKCIVKWAESSTYCPLCKKRFSLIKSKNDNVKYKKARAFKYEYNDEEEQNWYRNLLPYCMVCKGQDEDFNMLVCDNCNKNVCHYYCDGLKFLPPLDEVWNCLDCRSGRTPRRTRNRNDQQQNNNNITNNNNRETRKTQKKENESNTSNSPSKSTKNQKRKYRLKTKRNLKNDKNKLIKKAKNKISKAKLNKRVERRSKRLKKLNKKK